MTSRRPRTARAATGRNIAAVLLAPWQVRVTGADLVPMQGPVILAANHPGLLDGAVLAVASPRPLHVLTKSPLFATPLGPLLRATDQIAVDYGTPDRSALQQALDVLGRGGAVGIFPEAHRGAGEVEQARHGVAYLAARSTAPVVPVAILGTRPAGGGKGAVPPWRATIDVVVGAPVHLVVDGDPRRRAVLHASGERLRVLLADHVRTAAARTGQTLPGPLPAPTAERSTQ